MPCDDHSPQSHTWPPEGSVKAAFLQVESCETICGYCPSPQTDSGERKRFTAAQQLSQHVQKFHQAQDPDTVKEIEAHKWLKSRLDNWIETSRGSTVHTSSVTSTPDATVPEKPGATFLLRAIHDALWIRDEYRWAVEALLSTCFSQALGSSPHLDKDNQQQCNDFLDQRTEDFIEAHAPRLWPTSEDYRSHLVRNIRIYDKLWWSSGGSVKADGPIGTVHYRMSTAQKQAWNRVKPKAEYQGYQGKEEVLHSSLGMLVRDYLVVLCELYGTNQGAEGRRATAEEQSIGDLLRAITESA